MSGVELAGIVLGAIPLVISALEHYEDGLGKVKAFWKWEDELSNAIRQLWYQYTSYELSIRVLLSSILPDVDVEAMMSNPNAPSWTDPDMETDLKDKLSTAYTPYLHTIKDIKEAFSELANSLNLDRASHINQDALQALVIANPRSSGMPKARGYQFSKRIKFTMKKQRVKSLLDGLALAVSRLDSFHDKAEKLEPYRNNRKTRFVLPIIRLQNYASTLHAALHRLWTSSGHSKFMANLLLEQRLIPTKATKSRDNSGLHFDNDGAIKFTISISDPQLEWTMAEVHVIEPAEDIVKRNIKVQIAVSPPSPSLLPKASAKFATLCEITDLRSSLQSFQIQNCPTFHLELGQGKLKGVYPSNRQVEPHDGKFINLSDLLFKDDCTPYQNKLTREQSYILAVTLSSSLLQLHASPWLADRWNKRDIVFQGIPVSNNRQEILAQIRHPYIGHVCSPSTCDSKKSQDSQLSRRDDSARLLDLGVMLLEIYFNEPLEKFYNTEQKSPGTQSELEDFGIVKQWMSREKGNLSWAFQTAVTHCLRCFADPSASLHDPDFCQGVIDQIVTPLQDELSILFNGPTRS